MIKGIKIGLKQNLKRLLISIKNLNRLMKPAGYYLIFSFFRYPGSIREIIFYG